MSVEFSVFHDGQFWIGVLSLVEDGAVRACKVTFGGEPSDAELYDFVLKNGYSLLRQADANPVVIGPRQATAARNPKRAAREAAAQARRRGTTTAAQDAVRLAQEASVQDRKIDRRRAADQRAEREREVKRAKAKAKHRGR